MFSFCIHPHLNPPGQQTLICRVSMKEKNLGSLSVLRAQGPMSGLAVDWIHRLLYWTSMGSGSVHVGLLDGSAQRALLTGLQKPSAVAVDPLRRWKTVVPGNLSLKTCQRFNIHLFPLLISQVSILGPVW